MMAKSLLRFDGYDGEFYYFSTKSWTGTGAEYTISVNVSTGKVECTCMDAVCRHKQVRIHRPQDGWSCKHMRAVINWIQQRSQAQQ